jgi:hypothetical protein
MASILPYLPRAAFDENATRLLAAAFEAVCKEMHDTGQSKLVHEIIAKRMIAAASSGERDLIRLRDAGLAALGLKNRAI